MKVLIFIAGLICGLHTLGQSKIRIADFEIVKGKWNGTLTYLDYSSNKPVSIPANTLIEIVDDSTFDQYVYYTAEPDKNKKSRSVLNKRGDMLSEKKLLTKAILADGSIRIVLESNGPDGNDHRPATFQHIMILSPTVFKVTKLVKFNGESEFFQRHEYAYSR